MNDWIDAVADRAGEEGSSVETVLTRLHIAASPTLPRPRRLAVRSVRFWGERPVAGGTRPIEFRADLSVGTWCFASFGDNFAGKSSVLEVVRWALTGRPRLQDDVKSWLRRVELDAVIEGERFSIRFDTDRGRPAGDLWLLDPTELRVSSFTTEREFETVVGTFMLDRLGMEPTPFWQKRTKHEDGDPQILSWAGYATVLFIPDASYEMLLGQDSWAGQVPDLLRVFLGVPWAQTFSAARVAALQYRQEERGHERRQAEDVQVRERTVNALLERVEAARSVRDAIATVDSEVANIEIVLDSVRELSDRAIAARELVGEREAILLQVNQALRDEQQRVLDLTETSIAHRFLHGLEPRLCPRCDTRIDSARKEREASESVCSVCTAPLQIDIEDEADPNGAADVQEAVRTLTEAKHDAERQVREVQLERSAAERDLRSARDRSALLLSQQTDLLRRRHLAELEVSRLEGMLDVHREAVDAVVAGPSNDPTRRILDAAQQEAHVRMQAAEGDLFNKLNTEILGLGRAFGIDALESVRLDAGGRLKLQKGGEETWFSHVTRGERLRLKIAVLVAMLRLGERVGVGRHPGLLVIDSPGAEESGAEDFSRLLQELESLAQELPYLQILTASARADQVLSVLPESRVRTVRKGSTLW